VIAKLRPTAGSKETLADMLKRLGHIPPNRVLLNPPPGMATEKDIISVYNAPQKRVCELIDGVLVEKAMGTKEELLAGVLVQLIWNFLDKNDLGIALPSSGMLRILPHLVRIPDVSFISWARLPKGQLPNAAIAPIAPDLAVEVLSEGNTPEEMARKIAEYFQASVRLVWIIDQKKEEAKVYVSPKEMTRVSKDQFLDGRDVLPGFRVKLSYLFERGKRKSRRRQ
jgi:Uma2 family endonuclease